MKKITLIPIAGLCNRINAVRSAIGLKTKYPDIPISIYWPKDYDCYACFSELFKPINPKFLRGIQLKELNSFLLVPPSRRNLKLTRFLRKPFFDAEYLGSKISNQRIEDLLEVSPNLYIYSDNRFCLYTEESKVTEIFVPIDVIQKSINDVTRNFSDYTVGVHIRRTDNVTSIKESPLEKFEAMICKEIAKHKDAKFYIASDSEEVIKYLHSKYSDRIISGNWELSRKTVKGMQDAVAELYCLGSTKKIIGSKGSTYSTMASMLYGIPVVYD